MKNLRATLLLSLATAMTIGCASQGAKGDLEQRVAAEPAANTPEEIADRGAYDFITAPGLTHDQKEKVMAIYARTYKEAMAIREEIGKAKSLMFKTVAAKNFASGDVEKLKAKIVKLDQKRLDVMFKALADVQAVVGYGKDKEEIYRHFYDYEYPRHNGLSQTNKTGTP